MDSSLHNEDYHKRNEGFKEGLQDINTKYIKYFKSKSAELMTENKNSIEKYYVITNIESKPVLKITSNELPNEIKNDLINLFHLHWGK